MRADDEHDPLDSWLNQQVQPLPPPPVALPPLPPEEPLEPK